MRRTLYSVRRSENESTQRYVCAGNKDHSDGRRNHMPPVPFWTAVVRRVLVSASHKLGLLRYPTQLTRQQFRVLWRQSRTAPSHAPVPHRGSAPPHACNDGCTC